MFNTIISMYWYVFVNKTSLLYATLYYTNVILLIECCIKQNNDLGHSVEKN